MSHPLLFSPNPPTESQYIEKLFYGRENEVDIAMGFLKSDYHYGKICAVYGETQVGKSHFMMYLLQKINKDLKERYFTLCVNANNERTCIGVLATIYRELVQRFIHISENNHFDGKEKDLIELCKERIDKFARWERYPNLNSSEIILSYEQEQKFSNLNKQYSSGSIASKIWGIVSSEVRLGLERTQDDINTTKNSDSEKHQFSRPNEETYFTLILFISGVISLLLSKNDETFPRFLLYVDDLDLIEQPNGNERKIIDDMIDYLGRLAQHKHIIVITSVRDYFYYYREKDFHSFFELDFVDNANLIAIYNLQIKELNDGIEIFESEAVELLSYSSDRILGRFKRLLHEVHYKILGKNKYTKKEVLNVFKNQYLKSMPEIRDMIENKISSKTLQVLRAEINANILNMEPLLKYKHILYPLPTGDYEISKILIEALKDEK